MRSDDRDRAGHLHDALVRLPFPRAPRMLLPRVLAAVARPWYAREWLAWPLHWQAASLAVALSVSAAGWVFLSTSPHVAALESVMTTGATAARVLWRLVVQPITTHVLALAIAACFTCAAGWAALSRLACPGVPR